MYCWLTKPKCQTIQICVFMESLKEFFFLSVWQSIGLLFPNLLTKINPTHNMLLVYEKKKIFKHVFTTKMYVFGIVEGNENKLPTYLPTSQNVGRETAN